MQQLKLKLQQSDTVNRAWRLHLVVFEVILTSTGMDYPVNK